MKMTSGNSKMESVYLNASSIEQILASCIEKSSFSDIFNYFHRIVPSITESNVKEFLFYLINNSFIDCFGRDKFYSTSQEGIDLLDIIYSQKIGKPADYPNLTVKVQ